MKLIIDGHVHIHDGYDLDNFFNSAVNNLESVCHTIFKEKVDYQKILLLTESIQSDYFSLFFKNKSIKKNSSYSLKFTEEDSSLLILKNDIPQCYIFAGRQIVTKEGLEVLSIATTQKVNDGLSIYDCLDGQMGNKQISFVPWGAGKWLLKRGKIMNDLIHRYQSPYFFLADNSARPSIWKEKKIFQKAKELDIKILRGSDPLPFASEERRVGSYGFTLEGDFDASRPAHSFRQLLVSNQKEINCFGEQDTLATFFMRQTKMFYKKYVAT